jgi:tetratricopeptide (TPR) repeat protein
MALFERERVLGKLAHDPSGEGNAVSNLANRDMKRGDLDAAKAGGFRALKLFRRTGDPYQEAIGVNALGNIYRIVGKTDSSRFYFHETFRIAREHNYPFHELWALNNVGVLERDVGNYETAVECYRKALAIAKRIRFDRGIALASLNLSGNLGYLGRGDEAYATLDEGLAACKRAGFKDLEESSGIAAGDLSLDAGRNREAAAHFRRVLNKDYVFWTEKRAAAANGLSVALSEMDSVDLALEVLAPFVSPRANVTNFVAQPYFELDYIDLLRRAHRYDEALGRVAKLREELDHAGRTDMGVVARLMESDCRRELGDASRAAGALSTAMDSLEVARSEVGHADFREAYGVHLMSDVIDGCRVTLEYPPDTSWPDRVHHFYDALQRFKTRALLDRIKDPRGMQVLAGAIARPTTCSALQQTVLRQDELLLDMAVGADRTYMFAVTRDSCRLVTLPGWRSPLREQAYLYADILSGPGGHNQDAAAAGITPAQRKLGDAVLGPVADLIANAKRVLIAPDGFYAAIPFGTLAPGQSAMLLESKEVIDVPSASVLEWSREDTASTAHTAASLVAVNGGSAAGLAGAEREVEALRHRYANVDVVTAAPGVLDTLAQHARPGCILHVATHARMSDTSPWQSGFLLDPASSGAEENGVPHGETMLRAWEIARSHLPYDMAVLSSCETAAGRRTSGEGVLGLTSAFLSASVPVVVSSRWAVDDKVTADLMGHFYTGLAQGKNVAAALRDAQLAVRSNPRTRAPFYWAGFSVAGDGARVVSPLQLAPGGNPMPWILAGAAALVLGLGWLAYRRRSVPATAS